MAKSMTSSVILYESEVKFEGEKFVKSFLKWGIFVVTNAHSVRWLSIQPMSDN